MYLISFAVLTTLLILMSSYDVMDNVSPSFQLFLSYFLVLLIESHVNFLVEPIFESIVEQLYCWATFTLKKYRLFMNTRFPDSILCSHCRFHEQSWYEHLSCSLYLSGYDARVVNSLHWIIMNSLFLYRCGCSTLIHLPPRSAANKAWDHRWLRNCPCGGNWKLPTYLSHQSTIEPLESFLNF